MEGMEGRGRVFGCVSRIDNRLAWTPSAREFAVERAGEIVVFEAAMLDVASRPLAQHRKTLQLSGGLGRDGGLSIKMDISVAARAESVFLFS